MIFLGDTNLFMKSRDGIRSGDGDTAISNKKSRKA